MGVGARWAWAVSSGERARVVAELESLRPRTEDELHGVVKRLLGLDVPRVAVAAGSDAPFAYLAHAFFEAGGASCGDVVVWACRGGGKTVLGAVATLLDLVFKPGVQVRVLAGSADQAGRMFEHLVRFASLEPVAGLLAGPVTERRVELVNGSRAELLAASQASIRGQRVHKVRCDEVDLFSEEAWGAAQLTVRSGRCGGSWVGGAVEALSTMHRSSGLMSGLTRRSGRRVLRWTVLDVAGRCPESRRCEGCVVWGDCRGVLKGASGFVPVADVIASRERVTEARWRAEMMCERVGPLGDAVYGGFDPVEGGRHVARLGVSAGGEGVGAGVWVAGVDFGVRNPLVWLWARWRPGDPGGLGLLEVVDEYSGAGLTLAGHLAAVESRGWPRPAWLGVDPAGGARVLQTGLSDAGWLRARGYRVRAERSPVAAGVDAVRRRLERGALRIDARCEGLIGAMASYHYDASDARDERPVKDGPDHLCDALRYLVVSLERGSGRVERRWW